LWHGANWTFVIGGLFHGIGVAATHTIRRLLGPARALPSWLAVVITFHFVTLGWIFFRAPSVHVAFAMLHDASMGGGWSHAAETASANLFVAGLIAVLFVVHRFDDHRRVKAAVRAIRPEILWPILIALWVMAITISQGSSAKFIYFDF
jgi:hypothetical protein